MRYLFSMSWPISIDIGKQLAAVNAAKHSLQYDQSRRFALLCKQCRENRGLAGLRDVQTRGFQAISRGGAAFITEAHTDLYAFARPFRAKFRSQVRERMMEPAATARGSREINGVNAARPDFGHCPE